MPLILSFHHGDPYNRAMRKELNKHICICQIFHHVATLGNIQDILGTFIGDKEKLNIIGYNFLLML
jgi:hypothetical protein